MVSKVGGRNSNFPFGLTRCLLCLHVLKLNLNPQRHANTSPGHHSASKWPQDGSKFPFQTTVKAAGHILVAERIARLCWEKLNAGKSFLVEVSWVLDIEIFCHGNGDFTWLNHMNEWILKWGRSQPTVKPGICHKHLDLTILYWGGYAVFDQPPKIRIHVYIYIYIYIYIHIYIYIYIYIHTHILVDFGAIPKCWPWVGNWGTRQYANESDGDLETSVTVETSDGYCGTWIFWCTLR